MKIAALDKPQFIAMARNDCGWVVLDGCDTGSDALDMLLHWDEADWRILQIDEDEVCRFVTEDVLNTEYLARDHVDDPFFATVAEREAYQAEQEDDARLWSKHYRQEATV